MTEIASNNLPPASSSNPPASSSKLGKIFLVVAVGVVVGVVGERYGLAPKQAVDPARSQEDVRAVPAPFTKVGERIVVPPTSALRTILGVEPAILKDVNRTLVLPAVVEADPGRTVKVMPPVAGRITELKVQLGGRVKQGPRARRSSTRAISPRPIRISTRRGPLLTLTKKALDRQMSLEKAGGAAIKDREQAQSDYAQAVSELERSETRLRALGVATERKEMTRLLSIKAPITGSVTDLEIAPGAFVNDPTAAMLTIANLDTVWVTANVPEKDTSFVFNGQDVKVAFAAYPGKVFDGKVLFVSDVLEPDTRRTKVRIAFQNPDKNLKPNMFAQATFLAPAEQQLMVPTSALLMTNETTSVFVEVGLGLRAA